MVCEWEDGRIEIRYQGKAKDETSSSRDRAVVELPMAARGDQALKASRWKPPADHPERRFSMLRATTSAPLNRLRLAASQGCASARGPQHRKNWLPKKRKGHF